MAAKRLHWKEKGGRFYAGFAVPKALVAVIGKSELLESLGGDPLETRRPDATADPLALSFGRGVREDKWPDALALAGG